MTSKPEVADETHAMTSKYAIAMDVVRQLDEQEKRLHPNSNRLPFSYTMIPHLARLRQAEKFERLGDRPIFRGPTCTECFGADGDHYRSCSRVALKIAE